MLYDNNSVTNESLHQQRTMNRRTMPNVKHRTKKKFRLFFIFVGLTRLNPQKTCLEVGRRRTFSSRIRTKTKRNFGTTTPSSKFLFLFNDEEKFIFSSDEFSTIDFVGYLKEYSLSVDPSNESKVGHERRRGNVQNLTSADVFNAIGTTPVTCLLTMGSLAKRFDVQNDSNQCLERMFLWKLNSDGQFTYFDQM